MDRGLKLKIISASAITIFSIALIVLIVLTATCTRVNTPPKSPITIIPNRTLCTPMRQIEVDDGLRTTVCLYQNSLRVDLRYFVNGKATIQGIALNYLQWTKLKSKRRLIDTAIHHVFDGNVVADGGSS